MNSKGQSSDRVRLLRTAGVAVLILGVIFSAMRTFVRRPSNEKDGTGVAQNKVQFLRSAPQFELADSAGHSASLESFKGKFVILHFWASWCRPCLEEIPQWIELGNQLKDYPIQLISISEDLHWVDALKILPREKLTLNAVSLLDRSAEVSDLYGTFQFPETYLINAQQKILFKWVGPQDWSSKTLKESIVKFLNTEN